MKTTHKIIAFSLPLAACMLSFDPLWAQQQGNINSKVEVQRNYDGHIIEVEKPKIPALIPDSISQFKILLDYSIFDKPYDDLYSFSPLPSVNLSTPKTIRQPWTYIRLGALFPTSPLADLLVQAPLSGASALMMAAQHRSFWGELPVYRMAEKIIADQMQNRTDLRYALNWQKGRFEVGGGYDYNYYTYYGIAPEYLNSLSPANLKSHSFMRDHMAHVYSLYKADLSLSSLRSVGTGTEWSFTADWSRLEDKAKLWNVAGTSSCSENLVHFTGAVGIAFKSEHALGIKLYGTLSNNLYGSKMNHGVFSLNPYYQLRKERFLLHAGVILSLTPSVERGDRKSDGFFLYPLVKASYQIIPQNLTLYADVRGENRYNDYRSLLVENPWLNQSISLNNSDIRWMIQAGLKGKIANHLGYNLYGQHVKTNNQYYFRNTIYLANLHSDTPYPVYFNNLFTLQYADEERLSAVAELTWNSTPLTLYLTGKYHSYTVSNHEHAWYKPNTEVNFTLRYQWRERIIATASAVYKGSVFAPPPITPIYLTSLVSSYVPVNIQTFSQKIDPNTDIGLQLEYRFAEWFGLYIEGKNLLNTKNQNYLYYIEPGIRIGGGMTFRF